MEVRLSPKYQLSVPKDVRKKLDLHAGQKFHLITKEGIIAYVPDIPFKKMKGFLSGMDTGNLREEGERI